jgi:putative DNA primase/helicase
MLRETAVRVHSETARKIAKNTTVAAVAHMARTDRRIAAEADVWDADPWLLATPSGVVDLRTGKLRPARPEYHMTKITAVAPDGSCPTWLAFLHKSLEGDTELIAFLQRGLGYTLTGITRAHAMFFLFGPGGAGKGTFINTIARILGDYAKTAPIETFLAKQHESHSTDLAGLQAARLVDSQEVPQGRFWDETKLKALTGGDRISARFMRGDFFEYFPQFKLWVSGNHKPRLKSVGEEIRRRMNIIPFAKSIPNHERDQTLPEKLRAEWGGVLSWMIEGCLAWQRDGLQPPAKVVAATDSYLMAEDILAAWLDECCVVEPNAWAPRDALFSSWSVWTMRGNETTGSKRRFFEALRDRPFEETTYNGERRFKGLAVKPPPPYPPPTQAGAAA